MADPDELDILEEEIDLDDDQGIEIDAAESDSEQVELDGAIGGSDDDDEPKEMESIHDDSDMTFHNHTGSVFCCDLDPVGSQLVVSGGEDDRAYVWNSVNGNILFECTGHKDSVTCVAFGHDGSLVATGDMSGLIKVWKVQTKSEIWSFETNDLSWLSWHHSSHVLFAGNVDGEVWLWRIPGEDCKVLQGHGVQTDCGKLMPDGKRIAVAYGDGTVKVWDIKAGSALHTIPGSSSSASAIACMDCHCDNVLVATGALDGSTRLINTNTGKVVCSLLCEDKSSEVLNNSIESIGFCPSLPLCATGSLKGSLAIWDIPSQVLRQTCEHKAGIVRLVWDRVSPLIYTAGLDGVVRLWDARHGKVEAQWTGHNGEILDMLLSRDGSMIVTASDDKSCRVFYLNKPDR